ncbi:MAG TPA: NTP transferase domain-containing protein [Candidatus Hydrogenedentes bacterium]|nr:NTP transferase domain-containing protein [Candidatus Hydrogenedentota bacterium]
MSIIAVVPARGGSKGIPGKNIKPLCGRPMLYWVCRAANACPHIDAVYVSTDDDTIADTVRRLGLPKVHPIPRAPETATDQASTESVLLDFAQRVDFNHLVLLQATSPLLTSEDLKRGCEKILSGDCDSVLSVVRQTRFRWTMQEDSLAIPENYDPQFRPRRQNFAGFLVENGAFYITSRAGLLTSQCRLNGRIGTVEMPEDSYFELDDLTDWIIVENLLARRLQKAKGDLQERLRAIRFVASDVDGSLTDSGVFYDEHGGDMKRFSTRDGQGFALLRNAGLLTGLITQETLSLVARRSEKLRLDETHMGALDKVPVMQEILQRRGLDWSQAAYLGDDVGDLELLQRVGIAACPADAIPEVRRIADLVLDFPGGHGAFRDLAERILAARR